MKSLQTKWLQSLKEENIVEKFDTSLGQYYRIAPFSTFDISDNKIAQLKNEYTPGLEKGGFFLVTPEKRNGSVFFVIKEIRFVKNISHRPDISYRPDPSEFNDVFSYAIKNQLLPFRFHSHPTESHNILMESYAYNKQLDTSLQDKLVSLFSIVSFAESDLRLPDILVVCNGRLKHGIFIGFYGGLVAPLDFNDRKQKIEEDIHNRIENSLDKFFNSPEKRIVGALGILLLLLLLIKYPKAILTTFITGAAVFPSVIYSLPNKNIYFGVTYGMPLQISLPKVEDEILIADENYLVDLYDQKKKNQSNKAA